MKQFKSPPHWYIIRIAGLFLLLFLLSERMLRCYLGILWTGQASGRWPSGGYDGVNTPRLSRLASLHGGGVEAPHQHRGGTELQWSQTEASVLWSEWFPYWPWRTSVEKVHLPGEKIFRVLFYDTVVYYHEHHSIPVYVCRCFWSL